MTSEVFAQLRLSLNESRNAFVFYGLSNAKVFLEEEQ